MFMVNLFFLRLGLYSKLFDSTISLNRPFPYIASIQTMQSWDEFFTQLLVKSHLFHGLLLSLTQRAVHVTKDITEQYNPFAKLFLPWQHDKRFGGNIRMEFLSSIIRIWQDHLSMTSWQGISRACYSLTVISPVTWGIAGYWAYMVLFRPRIFAANFHPCADVQ